MRWQTQVAGRLTGGGWTLLGWVFPPRCAGCGALGSRWCVACQLQVQPIPAPYCPICGYPCVGGCDCPQTPPAYTALRSWGVYRGPLRKALQRLKFGGDLGVGEALARRLWGLLQTLPWTPEAVAPVPISRARRAERGYNQAGWIAGPLAWLSGIPYQPNCLQKPREIRSQVGLTMAERRANVQGAYCAVPNRAAGQRILLVDDITTTGATLDACAQALRDAGALEVWALTAARVLRPGTPISPTI